MDTRDDFITESFKNYKWNLKEGKNVPACIDSHRYMLSEDLPEVQLLLRCAPDHGLFFSLAVNKTMWPIYKHVSLHKLLWKRVESPKLLSDACLRRTWQISHHVKDFRNKFRILIIIWATNIKCVNRSGILIIIWLYGLIIYGRMAREELFPKNYMPWLLKIENNLVSISKFSSIFIDSLLL